MPPPPGACNAAAAPAPAAKVGEARGIAAHTKQKSHVSAKLREKANSRFL
jgi:hypothetical protein